MPLADDGSGGIRVTNTPTPTSMTVMVIVERNDAGEYDKVREDAAPE